MNSMKKLMCAGLALLMLAGCKDATAALANSKETLMTVGDTTITKGELYNMMFASVGANTANTDVMNRLHGLSVTFADSNSPVSKIFGSYSRSEMTSIWNSSGRSSY